MTTDRGSKTSPWVIVGVLGSVAVGVLMVGDRFWGPSSITSYQVTQLTQAMNALSGKMDFMAKQADVEALRNKFDTQQNQISEEDGRIKALKQQFDDWSNPKVRQP